MMFNPDKPYTDRDNFPEGSGVNRRIGYSELPDAAQEYLKKQKQLAILNFINPTIIFINRIPLGRNISFSFFTQYTPTHFGNSISLTVPIHRKNSDLLVGVHKFSNYQTQSFGLDLGTYNRRITRKIEADVVLRLWNQPTSFFIDGKQTGGAFELDARYTLTQNIALGMAFDAKTSGWLLGSPYLKSNISSRLALNYTLIN